MAAYLLSKRATALLRKVQMDDLKRQNEYCEDFLYHDLANKGLISIGCNEDGSPNYNDAHLTDAGIAHLEHEKTNNFRYWYPHIVGTLALILSIISLCLRR